MKLEEIIVYQMSLKIGEDIWPIIQKWDYFAKDTIGKQLVRAVDSIAANISEGFGRYHYTESKHFCYYARGSLFESKTWLTKAFNRKLILENDFKRLLYDIDVLGIKLNHYITSIGTQKRNTSVTEGEGH